MTKDLLIKMIFSAFSISNIPNSNNIVDSISGEAIEIKDIFISKQWDQVLTPDIIFHNSALGFLTDDAFRYYLPTYMLLLINNLYESDIVASSVVSQLTLPFEADQKCLMDYISKNNNIHERKDEFILTELRNSTKIADSFIKKMNEFTPQQGKCILNFLQYLSDEYPEYYDESEPKIAIDRYWFKYSNDLDALTNKD